MTNFTIPKSLNGKTAEDISSILWYGFDTNKKNFKITDSDFLKFRKEIMADGISESELLKRVKNEVKVNTSQKLSKLISEFIGRSKVWEHTAYSPSNVEKFTKIVNRKGKNKITIGKTSEYSVTVDYSKDNIRISSFGINAAINGEVFAKSVLLAAKALNMKLTNTRSGLSFEWISE